jgi:hypothetical protein
VRRCLHAFLVGVLMLSLSMNAARACWYLRHGGPVRHHVVVGCPPIAPADPVVVHAPVTAWAPVMVQAPVVEDVDAWEGGCADVSGDWPIAADVVIDAPFMADDCSCDCGGGVVDGDVVLEAETLGEEHVGSATLVEPAAEEGIGHDHHPDHSVGHGGHMTEPVAAPQPTLAEPFVEKTEPTPAAVPVLESTEEVRQAVAFGESERKLEPEVVLPAEPMQDHAAEPVSSEAAPPAVESNIFEEVDQAAAADEPAGAEPSEIETPADAPEASPAPAETSAPADPFAAVRPASREPARRWIDRSGDYATVGTLLAVRGDGTCELEAAGRTIEVPLEALSEFDRAYATAASERLAVRAAPESGDTAGL